jgi:hypothetical protein
MSAFEPWKENKEKQKEYLQGLLNKRELSIEEKNNMKNFYIINYETLGKSMVKYTEVEDVEIRENRKNGYLSYCFYFKFPGTNFHPIAMKYLTKSSRTSKSSPDEIEARKRKNILIETLRKTIHPQINDWKRENIATRKNSNDEADHYPKSFQKISEDFITNYESDIVQNEEELKSKTLNNEIKNKWEEFHKANASFRWIPKEKNRPGRPAKKQKTNE